MRELQRAQPDDEHTPPSDTAKKNLHFAFASLEEDLEETYPGITLLLPAGG